MRLQKMVEYWTETQEVFSRTNVLARLLWYSLLLQMTADAQKTEIQVWKLILYLKLEKIESFTSVVEVKTSILMLQEDPEKMRQS